MLETIAEAQVDDAMRDKVDRSVKNCYPAGIQFIRACGTPWKHRTVSSQSRQPAASAIYADVRPCLIDVLVYYLFSPYF